MLQLIQFNYVQSICGRLLKVLEERLSGCLSSIRVTRNVTFDIVFISTSICWPQNRVQLVQLIILNFNYDKCEYCKS